MQWKSLIPHLPCCPFWLRVDASGSPGLTLVHSNAKSKKKPGPLWPTGLVIGEQLNLFG